MSYFDCVATMGLITGVTYVALRAGDWVLNTSARYVAWCQRREQNDALPKAVLLRSSNTNRE